MAKGTIIRLVTGRRYGFIQTADGRDLFLNQSALQGVGYDSLREGQQVEFELEQDRNGRPKAVKVRLAQPKHHVLPDGTFPCAWPKTETVEFRSGFAPVSKTWRR